MLLELTIAGLALAALMMATYIVAVVAVRLFALIGGNAESPAETGGHRGFLIDAFARTPQHILLAADLLKSMALMLETALVVWGVPRWSAQLGLTWQPALIISLIVVWVLHLLTAEVLPKSAGAGGSDSAPPYSAASLAFVWLALKPFVGRGRVMTRRHPLPARS